jgi:acyl-CoA thioesterase-1
MRHYLWHHLRRYVGVGLTTVSTFLLPTLTSVGVTSASQTLLKATILGPLLVLASLAQADSPTKVLVVGDSLSAAYGLNMDQGWVNLLEQRLQAEIQGTTVINASISGETTRGGAYRLPALLDDYKPALVIIELGGNDGLRAMPIKQMRENLAAMTEASLAVGAQVLLLAAEAPPNLGRRYTELFRGIYTSLAEYEGVETLPFIVESVFLNPSLMQSDGIHPNATAQPLLVEVVWPTLLTMLKESSQ